MLNIELYGVFEWTGNGKTDGNPFTDYGIFGEFTSCGCTKKVLGFYDGDGVYKVRFMPELLSEYTYKIYGSFSDEAFTGSFNVLPAAEGNHGMVRARGYHFEYSDGTSFFPAGTTCYVWNHQNEELQKQTLEELSNGWFNKIRFCVFPKHYLYNLHEPISYPYEGTPCECGEVTNDYPRFGVYEGNSWDFYRFNPVHFRNVEKAILALQELGIEADLIMMHPYDRWGFSEMPADADDLYFKYCIARFGAYRNVWWSLANEYDLLKKKTTADWERYASILVKYDAFSHLRSIHNCTQIYDHSRPWITHASIQKVEYYKTCELVDEYRLRYRKPIIMDEVCYEGNIGMSWGNISGKELVRRFWEAAVRGGYCTHGETFVESGNRLWWSHGGKLIGESPARIKFLTEIMKQTPGCGLMPYNISVYDTPAATAEALMPDLSYFIYYFSFSRPSEHIFIMPEGRKYRAEVIDTWDMTITDAGVHSGRFTIKLPGKEYIAVRLIEEK